MQGPRLLVALAVAGALFSPVLAHRPLPSSPSSPFVPGIREVVYELGEVEIIRFAGDRVTKSVRWGRYVRWGGAIVIGATALLTALDWFYRELKRESGTSLDTWMRWDAERHWPWPQGDPPYDLEFVCWSPGGSTDPAGYDVYLARPTLNTDPDARAVYLYDGAELRLYYDVAQAGVARSVATGLCAGDRPSLADWIRDYPDAAEALRDILAEYVTAHPPSSFSEPWPGIRLDPPPTGNQWYDNPFFNPYEDSDGDGWPDWYEWDVGADPADPSSQPDPAADLDGDGYDNQAEREAGTDPTDPDSRPGSPGVDTDGDGLVDGSDPCPRDPNNFCGGNAQQQEEQQEQEQQQEQQEEQQQEEELPDPSLPRLTPVSLPRFDQPLLPEITSRFERVRINFEQDLQTLWDTLQDRFPVGMARWIPVPPSVSGGSCEMRVQLEIPDLPPAQVDVCNNPVMQWAASTGRLVVLASLMVGFLFAIARRASYA